jgi:hypothetical protein
MNLWLIALILVAIAGPMLVYTIRAVLVVLLVAFLRGGPEDVEKIVEIIDRFNPLKWLWLRQLVNAVRKLLGAESIES